MLREQINLCKLKITLPVLSNKKRKPRPVPMKMLNVVASFSVGVERVKKSFEPRFPITAVEAPVNTQLTRWKTANETRNERAPTFKPSDGKQLSIKSHRIE